MDLLEKLIFGSDVFYEPILPAKVILLFGGLVAAIAVVAYLRVIRQGMPWRGSMLLFLRLLSIFAFCVLLARPMKFISKKIYDGRHRISVLLDTSASMDVEDAGVNETRYEKAVRLLRSDRWQQADWPESYEVEYVLFDSLVRSTPFAEVMASRIVDGAMTDLATALHQSSWETEEEKVAGLVVLSDGRHNAGGEVLGVAQQLKQRNVPVYTYCIGSEQEVKDVMVTAQLKNSFLFLKQQGEVSVAITQSGYVDYPVTVKLFRENEYVESRRVSLESGVTRVTFPVMEESKGMFSYHVAVVPLKGELDVRNNDRRLFVRVIDEKTRVLMLDSRPYWDSKFLLRALQADPNLEVTSIFYLKPGKHFAIREETSDDTVAKTLSVRGLSCRAPERNCLPMIA